MSTDGQQMCECAYCHAAGMVYVRASLSGDGTVDGFVCLGGMTMPSGKLRALCAGCVRKANGAFARRRPLPAKPAPVKGARVSYCRMTDDSDAYMYATNVNVWACCVSVFSTRTQAITHLEENHSGSDVDRAIEKPKEELADHGEVALVPGDG